MPEFSLFSLTKEFFSIYCSFCATDFLEVRDSSHKQGTGKNLCI